ncbi:MAG: 1-deoxy-D-xylulose-5-phosphate reductoisomerase [Clostridia bacterium]|nr:1-deoxy-D-xylulose-5-phosphate reductoisomerase [Clostridia bacterium]
MKNRKIIVLGSTGSVGTQALDVAVHHGIKVVGISGSRSVGKLEEQIRTFRPEYCAVADEKAASDLKTRVADTECRIIAGKDSSSELAAIDGADTVINSVTGIAGLAPSRAAVRTKKTLALANKETIVTAGRLFMDEVREYGAALLPVDSEHSAIFQCLLGNPRSAVRKILLTASGGPFYGMKRAELEKITKEQTLAHPTWNMGPKITVDSATLRNKGFEVIEAVHLFGVEADTVEVVVHRESIIHSMVEYEDGAVIAQLSVPDMRLCVQYALSYPERFAGPLKRLDLKQIGKLTFSETDTDTFRLLAAAYKAAKLGGISGAVLNGANERAVGLFLNGKISFTDITDVVCEVFESFDYSKGATYADIIEADLEAREKVDSIIRKG